MEGLVVNPVTVTELVPQPKDVREPHAPENTCILVPEELKLLPMLVRFIIAVKDVAANLYQISSSGVPTQVPTGMPLLLA